MAARVAIIAVPRTTPPHDRPRIDRRRRGRLLVDVGGDGNPAWFRRTGCRARPSRHPQQRQRAGDRRRAGRRSAATPVRRSAGAAHSIVSFRPCLARAGLAMVQPSRDAGAHSSTRQPERTVVHLEALRGRAGHAAKPACSLRAIYAVHLPPAVPRNGDDACRCIGSDDDSVLAIGVAGFVGTMLIGAVLKRAFHATLVAILTLMAAITLRADWPGPSHHQCRGAADHMGTGVATAAPAGWWSWITRTFPDHAEAGGGLMVAVVQLSIALGSTVGGILFDTYGYRSTLEASALLLLIGAGLAWMTARAATIDGAGDSGNHLPASTCNRRRQR